MNSQNSKPALIRGKRRVCDRMNAAPSSEVAREKRTRVVVKVRDVAFKDMFWTSKTKDDRLNVISLAKVLTYDKVFSALDDDTKVVLATDIPNVEESNVEEDVSNAEMENVQKRKRLSRKEADALNAEQKRLEEARKQERNALGDSLNNTTALGGIMKQVVDYLYSKLPNTPTPYIKSVTNADYSVLPKTIDILCEFKYQSVMRNLLSNASKTLSSLSLADLYEFRLNINNITIQFNQGTKSEFICNSKDMLAQELLRCIGCLSDGVEGLEFIQEREERMNVVRPAAMNSGQVAVNTSNNAGKFTTYGFKARFEVPTETIDSPLVLKNFFRSKLYAYASLSRYVSNGSLDTTKLFEVNDGKKPRGSSKRSANTINVDGKNTGTSTSADTRVSLKAVKRGKKTFQSVASVSAFIIDENGQPFEGEGRMLGVKVPIIPPAEVGYIEENSVVSNGGNFVMSGIILKELLSKNLVEGFQIKNNKEWTNVVNAKTSYTLDNNQMYSVLLRLDSNVLDYIDEQIRAVPEQARAVIEKIRNDLPAYIPDAQKDEMLKGLNNLQTVMDVSDRISMFKMIMKTAEGFVPIVVDALSSLSIAEGKQQDGGKKKASRRVITLL